MEEYDWFNTNEFAELFKGLCQSLQEISEHMRSIDNNLNAIAIHTAITSDMLRVIAKNKEVERYGDTQ